MAEGKTQDQVVKEMIFALPASIHIPVLYHDRIHLMVKLQAHVHKLVNFKEMTKLSAIW
jgi:Tfp pilus assembly protein PilO